MVSRRGHRIDLIDEDGRTEGITLSTTGDKLQLDMDAVGTKVTVHSDGKVLIEGKGGIIIDAGSSPSWSSRAARSRSPRPAG